MTGFEDAVQAAMMAIYGVDTSSARAIATRAIAGFLAALPPSIVVDGKVVEVSRDGDVAEWLEDACATAGISLDAFAYVIDAAREVAE